MVAVPSRFVPSKTLTVLLASPVPVRITWLVPVMTSSTMIGAMMGVEGPVAAFVTLYAADRVLTSPGASTAMAVKALMPWGRVPVTNDQAPLALAVAAPISVVPSNTMTVLLAAAVPVTIALLRPLFDVDPVIIGVGSAAVALGISTMMG